MPLSCLVLLPLSSNALSNTCEASSEMRAMVGGLLTSLSVTLADCYSVSQQGEVLHLGSS